MYTYVKFNWALFFIKLIIMYTPHVPLAKCMYEMKLVGQREDDDVLLENIFMTF